MKVSLKTLADYVDITHLSTDDIANRITRAGIEVASISSQVVGSNIEIGQIIKIEKHPNADSLNVCQVQLKEGISQIVCGAPNVKEMLKVIVAKPGAVLHGDFKIKKSVIRDIESNGMICSLGELGISAHYLNADQQAGIEPLGEDAIVGEDPIKYLGLDDLTVELDLTPNRADCLSVYDFGFEIAAVFEEPLKTPLINEYQWDAVTTVNIDVDPELSSRFIAFKLKNIQVLPSPTWLKNRLMAMGVKSVNNIVDIANYVMLVTGQPIHTYDSACLENDNLTVKKTGSSLFVGLDGNEYQTQDDIGIFSNDKLVGLAGIMGSDSSKISDTTTEIVIEVASFNAAKIRQTAKRTVLFTDASTRFIKGINESNESLVISMLCALLGKYASQVSKLVGECIVRYETHKFEANTIEIDLQEINDTLMLSLTVEDVKAIFSRLSFDFELHDSQFKVKTMNRRQDIELPCDLIEEVARIYGYDHLPSCLPNVQPTTLDHSSDHYKQRQLKHMLSHLGLYEAVNYSLVDKRDMSYMNFEPVLQLHENTGRVKQYMRQSLIPSLMTNIKHNHAYSSYNTALFEISNVYGMTSSKTLLTCLMEGDYHQSVWQHEHKKVDFYVIKAILEQVMSFLALSGRMQLKAGIENNQCFHDYQCATVLIDYKPVGYIGRMHPNFEANYDVSNVFGFELDLDAILKVKSSKIKYKKLSRYQSVQRDLSLLVNEDMIASDIISTVNKAAKKLASEVIIFDIYQDEKLKEVSQKSMGVAVTLQSHTQTLTDQDITTTMNAIIEALKKLGATIRGM